jgi:MazG family protein
LGSHQDARVPLERPAPIQDENFITKPEDADRASFGRAFERIVGLMARLRAQNGCPWDRAQDLRTLRPYLIEESYEVIEAIDKGVVLEHLEELGDLLLQVVFQAEIRREEGAFDAADVAHAIADKLVRRHPHVFGDKAAHGPEDAFKRWEEMKAKEKVGRSVLAGVPPSLPALLRAQRVQEKASQVGFDWPDVQGPLDKVKEEVAELEAAMAKNDAKAIEHELGDALFSIVNVARFLHASSEDALRASIDRFTKRFAHVEAGVKARNKALKESTLDEMEALWNEAKREEG